MRSNVGYVNYSEVYPASIDFFKLFCSELFSLGECFHHNDVILAIRERFPFRNYLQC
jgi:hypothetical protein